MANDVLHNDYLDNVILYKTGSAVPVAPRYTIHLFVNDITPTCLTLLGALSECTLTGYAPIVVPDTDWIIHDWPDPGDCDKTAIAGPYDFEFSDGGQTIYGLWVYDTANDLVAWTKRFGDPYLVPSFGGELTVSLRIVEQETP